MCLHCATYGNTLTDELHCAVHSVTMTACRPIPHRRKPRCAGHSSHRAPAVAGTVELGDTEQTRPVSGGRSAPSAVTYRQPRRRASRQFTMTGSLIMTSAEAVR